MTAPAPTRVRRAHHDVQLDPELERALLDAADRARLTPAMMIRAILASMLLPGGAA